MQLDTSSTNIRNSGAYFTSPSGSPRLTPRTSTQNVTDETDKPKQPKLSRTLSLKNMVAVLSPRSERRLKKQDSNVKVADLQDDRKALFSVILQRALKYETAGFLTGQGGDKITILEVEGNGIFIGRNGRDEGKIVGADLEIDKKHAPNAYLELADAFAEHPDLLALLLEGDCPEIPNRRSYLFELLRARKVLPKALVALFAHELKQANTPGKRASLFREETSSILLSVTIFNSSAACLEFRKAFITKVASLSNAAGGTSKLTAAQLIDLLKKTIEYLAKIPRPPELILVLGSLKKAATVANFSSGTTPLSVRLGTLLFLQFLCPGFYTVPIAVNDRAVIAKKLQLIANQEDPIVDSEFYTIRENLRELHQPLAEFLNKVADLPLPTLEVPATTLVSQAASIYWLTAKEEPAFAEESPVKVTLTGLKRRLGSVPKGPVQDEKKAPMHKEIEKITKLLATMEL